jgi:rhodanese-related sulfurtransferase
MGIADMSEIKEVDAKGLQELMDSGEKIRLFDVRSATEYNQGIIEGGEYLPLHTVPVRINDFKDSDETIVFYCRSGMRSGQACTYVKQNADIDAINLRGGIMGWNQTGLQIAQPEAAVA